MNQPIRVVALLAGSLLLAACGSMGKKEETAPAQTVDQSSTGTATDKGSATATGAMPVSPTSLKALDEPSSPVYSRVIYFDFDRSEVKPESQTLIAAHAALLAANPGIRVRLEGHADERGSREYNLGLGERRSKAVDRLLVLNGAGANQLESVSYGEERPVALGHDESSWWQNRRVEIVYPSR
ncbi:MAG TPA: peptidoglycan-associated lipoprotein Pal [Gammaproteobacteria bacterium]